MINFLTGPNFPIIIILFFGTLLLMLFSRKGRNIFVSFMFGKTIKDYGDMGSSKLYGLYIQTVHLYECSNKNENFFILESRMFMNVQYTKISSETARNLINAMSSSGN